MNTKNDFKITEEVIEEWAELFKNEQNKLKCPSEALIIAYANDELEGDVQKAIDEHLDYCTPCLDLMLSVRAAKEETKNIRPSVLPEKLLCAIYDSKENLTDYRGAKIIEFKNPLPIREEKLNSWFTSSSDRDFALAAQDRDTERKILLKIIKNFKSPNEELFVCEAKVIDELYDAGELYLTCILQDKCVIENLIACYALWNDRDKEIKNRAYRCIYDAESGMFSMSFKCNEIPEGEIKQILCICE